MRSVQANKLSQESQLFAKMPECQACLPRDSSFLSFAIMAQWTHFLSKATPGFYGRSLQLKLNSNFHTIASFTSEKFLPWGEVKASLLLQTCWLGSLLLFP